MSEALSWLAQFVGQGFEDLSALANLVLLQEMMMGEEYQLIAGSSQNLPGPPPRPDRRTAGSNETALTGVTSNIAVKVTALNYFGETAVSASSGNITWSAGQVVDVTSTVSPVRSSTTSTSPHHRVPPST